MKERPILFSGPMVRALREGRKMQTRRMVKPQPTVLPIINDTCLNCGWLSWVWREGGLVPPGLLECCPYGQPGDQLYVKEKHAVCCLHTDPTDEKYSASVDYHATDDMMRWDGVKSGRYHVAYAADYGEPIVGRWRPSIHMPRWASRILLEVVGVRVERVQDITEADAIAEGFAATPSVQPGWDGATGGIVCSASDNFLRLFYDINKRAPRDANPWVWVVEFKRIEAKQ